MDLNIDRKFVSCPICGVERFKVIDEEDLMLGRIDLEQYEHYTFICENGHVFNVDSCEVDND